MNRSIAHLLIIVCLLSVTLLQVPASAGACPPDICRCGASAPLNHAVYHAAAGVSPCGEEDPCPCLKAPRIPEATLLIHNPPVPQLLKKPLDQMALASTENALSSAYTRHIFLIKEYRPGRILPAYLQNLALLC
ncbi:MAG: hypothetical protein C4519_03360 [Desulfobacteraceae bacterium]|nr:MAG: hypothetical protein C4519_03360 [Desulfobacteraceae bacterium]